MAHHGASPSPRLVSVLCRCCSSRCSASDFGATPRLYSSFRFSALPSQSKSIPRPVDSLRPRPSVALSHDLVAHRFDSLSRRIVSDRCCAIPHQLSFRLLLAVSSLIASEPISVQPIFSSARQRIGASRRAWPFHCHLMRDPSLPCRFRSFRAGPLRCLASPCVSGPLLALPSRLVSCVSPRRHAVAILLFSQLPGSTPCRFRSEPFAAAGRVAVAIQISSLLFRCGSCPSFAMSSPRLALRSLPGNSEPFRISAALSPSIPLHSLAVIFASYRVAAAPFHLSSLLRFSMPLLFTAPLICHCWSKQIRFTSLRRRAAPSRIKAGRGHAVTFRRQYGPRVSSPLPRRAIRFSSAQRRRYALSV